MTDILTTDVYRALLSLLGLMSMVVKRWFLKVSLPKKCFISQK